MTIIINKAEQKITAKQLIFIIIGAQIAVGIFSLPRLVTMEAGQDGWWVVIPAAVIAAAIPVLLIDYLGRNLPPVSFAAASQILFGQYVGIFLAILFVLYVIGFEAVVIRIYADLVKVSLLPETPLWVILLTIAIVLINICTKGIKTIGRLNEFLFYLSLVITLLILIPIIYEGDLTNILPVGEASLAQIGKGIWVASFALVGPEVLLIIYPMVTNKQGIRRAALTGISITTIIYVLVIIGCILVYGVEVMSYIVWPVVVLLKIVDIPVISRLDFLFLSMWMVLGVRPALNLGFAASYTLGQVFKINLSKHFGVMTIIVFGSMFYLALLPPNLLVALEWAEYAGILVVLISYGYPLLYILALHIYKRKAGRL